MIFKIFKTKKDNISIGNTGESLACKFLKRKGYKIIERNHRQKWGEIDIITVAPDKTLVFIEVKTLKKYSLSDPLRQLADSGESKDYNYIIPEDNLTAAKLKKLQRTCYLYANAHLKLINDDRGWRIDLIAIDYQNFWHHQIRHYENI